MAQGYSLRHLIALGARQILATANMVPTCGTPHVGSLNQCMDRLREGYITRIDCLLEVKDSSIYFPKLVYSSVS